MMMGTDIRKETDALAARILDTLASAENELTAWDLKMSLKVSHTRLHLALGALQERGKIRLRPDSLTFVVEPVTQSSVPSQPAIKETVGATAEKLG